MDLADYVVIAAALTGPSLETVGRLPNLGLADSALHSPAATFDGTDFYPGKTLRGGGIVDRGSRLVHLVAWH